jgi:exodeoxyribonuclease VII small subunit
VSRAVALHKAIVDVLHRGIECFEQSRNQIFETRNGGFRGLKVYCEYMIARERVAADAVRCGASTKAAARFFVASCQRQMERQEKMNSASNKAAEAPRKGEFEKSLTRLEEVVKRLEGVELSLDEAMKLFEEGVKLSRDCQKQLEEAEGRVEILLKKADGKLVAETFEPEDESS